MEIANATTKWRLLTQQQNDDCYFLSWIILSWSKHECDRINHDLPRHAPDKRNGKQTHSKPSVSFASIYTTDPVTHPRSPRSRTSLTKRALPSGATWRRTPGSWRRQRWQRKLQTSRFFAQLVQRDVFLCRSHLFQMKTTETKRSFAKTGSGRTEEHLKGKPRLFFLSGWAFGRLYDPRWAIYIKNAFFFEFSLCLSRACLVKKSAFIYKWLKKTFFAQSAPRWADDRCVQVRNRCACAICI